MSPESKHHLRVLRQCAEDYLDGLLSSRGPLSNKDNDNGALLYTWLRDTETLIGKSPLVPPPTPEPAPAPAAQPVSEQVSTTPPLY